MGTEEESNKRIADQDRANTDQDRVNTDRDRADALEHNRGIAERITELDASLERVHDTLKKEGIKRDKRIRTNRIAIFLATAAAIVGIVVGAWGIRATDNANNERDSARTASCLQYNKQQRVQINAEISESHDIVNALTEDSVDPNTPEKARLYNEEHDALIRKSHPLRDCSSNGIEKYLSSEGSND